MNTAKYRSNLSTSDAPLIGLSISWQRDHLLARGFGLEHLRDLLIRLARPLLRQGANLAYGGHWKETEDNFTFDLLRLISAEQQDSEFAAEPEQHIGRLYNHCPWPNYLDISPTPKRNGSTAAALSISTRNWPISPSPTARPIAPGPMTRLGGC